MPSLPASVSRAMTTEEEEQLWQAVGDWRLTTQVEASSGSAQRTHAGEIALGRFVPHPPLAHRSTALRNDTARSTQIIMGNSSVGSTPTLQGAATRSPEGDTREISSPPPYERNSLPSATDSLQIRLPTELGAYLHELEVTRIVLLTIGRCLAREPGHEPERWRGLVHMCGLTPEQSERVLAEMANPY